MHLESIQNEVKNTVRFTSVYKELYIYIQN